MVGCIGISGKFSVTIFNPASMSLSHNICPESKNDFSSYFKANLLNQNVPLPTGSGEWEISFFSFYLFTFLILVLNEACCIYYKTISSSYQ
uniref:Uncharacterized protein n=1 Tax=Octopus bimaculoides TaxID=37653 RepID=A0A0L8HXQ2_OCTBM